ncbi:hypothetical protein NL676_036057 [Syzygium grande]|nr:hypothetical protein NL676_036057 [Syzygium grande]
MKGHVDVLECLVRARPDAAGSVVEHGQTILQLCGKHNRLEALKLLLDILGDDQFINSRDKDGNTILHLAAVDRQTETIDFLVNKGVNLNITNSRDFTALGLLAQATIAYEAGMNLPDESAKADEDFDEDYKLFIACNMISFIASLSTIMLLISGLLLERHRITTWIAILSGSQ